ncbi:MAG: hypothetical protein ACK4K7_11975 [Allosphingosinicella sp.]|uniref:hypothetical protein n=1 Tax=Allosphingosinicella sp. TaxID=2823234 RepID=UPI003922EEFC
MARYRLYRLDARSGRILDFEEIDAIDHEAAATASIARLGTHPLELWSGKQKVARFEVGQMTFASRSGWG